MAKTNYTAVDEYFSTFPEDIQAVLDISNDIDARATADRVQDAVSRGVAGFVAG